MIPTIFMKYRKFFISLFLLSLAIICIYSMDRYLQGFWRTLIMFFGINVILAISLNITNGWINFFSIGHGGIMLAGAYVAAFFTLPPSFKAGILHLALPEFILNTQWPLFPALLLGGLVGALVGVILAMPALRLKSFYFCAGSLGFNVIITTLAENFRTITNGPSGLRQFPQYTNLWWVWGVAFFTIYTVWMIKKSYIGRAFISIGRDQDLAEHMGINLLKYKVYAFALSGFFSTVGAILWVHLILNLYPNAFGLVLIFDIVAMIVIGGMGSITGSIIGAGIITFFVEVLSPLEEGFTILGTNVPSMLGLTTILLGILLIVVLIKRPQGVMGEKEISLQYFKDLIKHPIKQ